MARPVEPSLASWLSEHSPFALSDRKTNRRLADWRAILWFCQEDQCISSHTLWNQEKGGCFRASRVGRKIERYLRINIRRTGGIARFEANVVAVVGIEI